MDASEIGAWCSSHTYAVKASREPNRIRYPRASAERTETAWWANLPGSPVTAEPIASSRPPATISIAEARNGLPGMGSRWDRNEPSDQDTAAKTTISPPPTGTLPAPPRDTINAISPANPSTTPSRVAMPGRSPLAKRNTTISSGTVATSSAAAPDGTPRDSATTTAPLPPASSSTPTRALDPISDSLGLARPRCRASTTPPRIRPASTNRSAAERNGGNVSTENRIARYVEPQTRYTITSASQIGPVRGATLAPFTGAVIAAQATTPGGRARLG